MTIKIAEETSFHLENFEGPLHYLLQLVQKSELDISHISLKEIILQYLTIDGGQSNENRCDQASKNGPLTAENNIDTGAEFIGITSLLLWLKSKMLLPIDEQPSSLEELDSPFSILPMLVEHIRFKQLAKELSQYEERQNAFYTRPFQPREKETKKFSGLETIALEQILSYFQQAIQKAHTAKATIYEEVWRVADKIEIIRKLKKKNTRLEIAELFTMESPKEELIVLFLAILELMKLGEVGVSRQVSDNSLWLINI